MRKYRHCAKREESITSCDECVHLVDVNAGRSVRQDPVLVASKGVGTG